MSNNPGGGFMQTTIQPKDVAIESSLLNIMANKNNYELYIHLIDYKKLLSNTSIILKDYDKYYTLYPEHNAVDWGLFYTQFVQNWHTNEDEQEITYYRDYVFPAIQTIEVDNSDKCIIGLLKKCMAEEALKHLDDLIKLREILDKYEEKINGIQNVQNKEDVTAETVDLSALDKSNGIPHFLPSFQAGLGGITIGDFIVVPGDVNTGKTAWAICQVSETLRWKLNNPEAGPVLFLTSEDTEGTVFARVWSNLYADSLVDGFEQVCLDRHKVQQTFIDEHGKDSLIVVHMSNIENIKEVKKRIVEYKPCLMVTDIADKLAPDEDAQNLKRLYDQLRLLSTMHCPILATTQAGVTEYFDKEDMEQKARKWLTLKDLYGSKTGKAGAATIVIGIGKDMRNKNIRYINTAKKKRGKNVQLECEFIEKYSMYKELAW